MNLRPEILLHPNIPKPLHGLNPRTIMGQEWWDEQRQIAYAKTNYCCAACGVHKSEAKYHKWLEAHELYEIDYKKGTMTIKEIVALCHACHNYIHSGRMSALVRKGEMTAKMRDEIIAHGDKLTAHLERNEPPEVIADWGDWNLIMDGKRFSGKFKSFADWALHYG